MNSHQIITPDKFSPEEAQFAGASHNVQDKWVRARLYEWFIKEGPSRCWVCIQHEDGRWYYWSKGKGKDAPPGRKRQYARAVAGYLNKECHFDGMWITAWLDAGWSRFYLLWKDAGGDIQIPMDTAGGLTWEGSNGFSHWPMDAWGHLCSNAHELWEQAERVVAATDEQKLSLAKTEAGA